ncbi:ROK family protein [Streptomyces sp. 351MFTsu5.1]|uniref:ROK family protein n=1 Tax=Streptomyces sp. 351MFTsu5.1 TaxID=1172180 RepID=UPI0003AACA01|nr:ROK family protein [Streptomyces sp. 351MFTsu5.1]
MNRETAALRPGEQSVLLALQSLGRASRRQLSLVTGLPRTTLTAAVSGLLERGLLVEDEDTAPRAGAGRPATVLHIALANRTVAVVEFGHHVQATTLVSYDGRVLGRADLPARAERSMSAVITGITENIKRMTATPPDSMVVALGMPVLRDGRGLWHARPHGPGGPSRAAPVPAWRPAGPVPAWMRADPVLALEAAFMLPLQVANDANLAALGEAEHGAARGARAAVCLSVLRGYGAGIVINGRLFNGAAGVAGELAHVSVSEDGTLCACGGRGCLATTPRGHLAHPGDLLAFFDEATGMHDVLGRAQHDPRAQHYLIDIGRTLAEPLAGFLTLLNPDTLVVDADLGAGATFVISGLQAALRRRVAPPAFQALRIVPGELARHAIAVGGAVLARQRYIEALVSPQRRLRTGESQTRQRQGGSGAGAERTGSAGGLTAL